MDRNVSSHDRKLAEEAVSRFNENSLLGKNTKLMEDGETYQIRIGDALRVQFKLQEDGDKEIVDIFKKGNHISSKR